MAICDKMALSFKRERENIICMVQGQPNTISKSILMLAYKFSEERPWQEIII